MKKRPTCLIITISLLTFLFISSQCSASDVASATITSVSGDVVVKRLGARNVIPAKVLMRLYEEDTLWTREVSKATLIFQGTGRMLSLGPQSEFLVENGEKPGSKNGLLTQLIAGWEELFGGKSNGDEELLPITGAIRKEREIHLDMPIQTILRDGTPTISWSWDGEEDVASYKLTIRGPEGVLLRETTSATSISLAERQITIPPESVFTVNVTATTVSGDKVSIQPARQIYVAGKDDLEKGHVIVKAIEEHSDPPIDESTKNVLMATHFEKYGFKYDAYRIYQDVLSDNPEAEYATEGIKRIEVWAGIRFPEEETG